MRLSVWDMSDDFIKFISIMFGLVSKIGEFNEVEHIICNVFSISIPV